MRAGERDAEPAGEEHAAGEHDLEDLEPRQEEEGGAPFCSWFVSPLLSLRRAASYVPRSLCPSRF